jgi:hypothetical protein
MEYHYVIDASSIYICQAVALDLLVEILPRGKFSLTKYHTLLSCSPIFQVDGLIKQARIQIKGRFRHGG